MYVSEGANMDKIKDIRTQKKLTQQQAADLVGISLRSYKTYENDPSKIGSIKYIYIHDKLQSLNPIDEEHGILSLIDIQKTCHKIFENYNIEYCILFGSYAKEKALENSDIDLLISSDIKGLKFYELAEQLRTALHKKIDLLDINQLKNNFELTKEILKDGIRIYG